MRNIPFSPPDISEEAINEVVKTLKSGWITTGPKTKLFENMITKYCGTDETICLNSATAGMEMVLKSFGIKKGDEVITTPYTYAATANVILHTGAKVIFADTKKNDFNIDPNEVFKKITKKTKAIISVDFSGFPVDYDEIKNIIDLKKKKFKATKKTQQENLNRILYLSDAAHSFGAEYKNEKIGSQSDFTIFSFHAVKNLTTAEGGAITFKKNNNIDYKKFIKDLRLLSLHGQSKDAFTKNKGGSWKYDILLPGYKNNMTDIQAALGVEQLKEYDLYSIKRRKEIFNLYKKNLSKINKIVLPVFETNNKKSSYHLFPIKIKNILESDRDVIIKKMSKKGISLNVHFTPLPMFSLFKKLGYNIRNFKNSYEMYKNEITLPVYTKLNNNDINYICEELKEVINKF